ncbi:MAG: bifunctional methylenetetrahydrofolate dehydrogenase/methenyltetrahydrofolate cyclohydrolase FolD [Endomicrobiales bacterium]|nr:bifunctional methylenetetrahydrofolate dehydrogenase/methenyltetrahydrofolate cyclohydrolase FolD [Endomicrobiales bacterium]
MKIIDGKKISQEIKNELRNKLSSLKKDNIEPGLATILVGDNPASKVYVSSKIKTCNELGIKSFSNNLPETTTSKRIIELIQELNNNNQVNGILLQLPLPKGIDADKCLEAISPLKDVDGLHPHSLGQLYSMKTWDEIVDKKIFIPCTPLGIITLLKKYNIEISGKKAVVIGRSNLVGKPIAMLLLAHNATVTMAHSRTKEIEKISKEADILVAAIGKERFVNKNFVKEGAVVIDVGTNRTPQGLCGDVDFDSVKDIASYITPSPGGVGPMTITMLMQNTMLANAKQRDMLERV